MTSTVNHLSLLYGSWTTVDNVITISPIPEPMTIILLNVSVALGLARWAARRKKAA